MTTRVFDRQSLALQQQIDRLAAGFEDAWKSGQPRPIEEFIDPTLPGAIRRSLVEELSAIEWELRVERGESPTQEEYAKRFPGIDTANIVPVDDEGSVPGSTSALHAGRLFSSIADMKGDLPQIPGYQVLERIGRGGAGIVYKAADLKLKRTVAIKVLHQVGYTINESPRFLKEAEALARLRHPNVVQIFEIGEHDGKAFMVLEFAEGGTLRDQLAGKSLPAEVAARITIAMAKAVGFAHCRGVVHRDIKPSNLLLDAALEIDPPSSSTKRSGPKPPSADFDLKVTDFGLAKRLDADDESLMTQTGTVMGTPAYMAPEQARGDRTVGTSVDIYSIGAVLYELLTGRPPFLSSSVAETLRLVSEKDPVPPRSLQPELPRDVETICLKCLEKDPARRYTTAEALVEDCERYLRGEPVVARRASPLEVATKWMRRHPALTSAIAIAVIAFFLTVWQWRVAELAAVSAGHHRQFAEQQQEIAEQNLNDARNAAREARRQEKFAVEKTREARREEAKSHLRVWRTGVGRGEGLNVLGDLIQAHQAEEEAYVGEEKIRRSTLAHLRAGAMLNAAPRPVGYWHNAGNRVRSAISPGGQILVESNVDREHFLVPWFASENRQPVKVTDGDYRIGHFYFSRFDGEGKTLAATTGRGFVLIDCATGQVRHTLNKQASFRDGIAFSPSGDKVAQLRMSQRHGPSIMVWDTESGEQLGAALRIAGLPGVTTTSSAVVAFSSSGDALYTVLKSGVVRFPIPFDFQNPPERITKLGGRDFIWVIDHDPRHNEKLVYFALGSNPRCIILDTETEKQVELPLPESNVLHQRPRVAFSPDGGTFAHLVNESEIVFVDLDSGAEERRKFENSVSTFDWDPSGRYFAVAFDRSVLLTLAETNRQVAPLITLDDTITGLTFDPSGRFFFATTNSGSDWMWDLAPLFENRTVLSDRPVNQAAWSPDGTHVAIAVETELSLHGVATGAVHPLFEAADPIESVKFTNTGNHLFFKGKGRSAIVSLAPFRVVDLPTTHLALNHDGSAGLVGPNRFMTVPKKLSAFRRPTVLHQHNRPVISVAFSPDDQHALYQSDRGHFLADYRNDSVQRLTFQKAYSVAADYNYLIRFNLDGSFAIAANYERGLCGIDCWNGRGIVFEHPLPEIVGIFFDSDPQSALVCLKNGTLLRCDTLTGETLEQAVISNSSLVTADKNNDDLLAVANFEGNVQYWVTDLSDMEIPPVYLANDVKTLSFRPGTSDLLTLTANGMLELHTRPQPLDMDWVDAERLARFLEDRDQNLDKQAEWNDLAKKYPRYFQPAHPTMAEWHQRQLAYALVESDQQAVGFHLVKLRQLPRRR